MGRLQSRGVKTLAAVLAVGLGLGFLWMLGTATFGLFGTQTSRTGNIVEPQIGFNESPPVVAPGRAPFVDVEPIIVEAPGPGFEAGAGVPGGQVVPFQPVPSFQDRFVVFTESISMNVTNVQQTVAELDFLASSVGGYISQSTIRPIQKGSRVNQGILASTMFQASVTLRIPSDRYSEATAEIIDMGELLSMSTSSSDVSDQYVDLQARITNLESVLEQYRLILSRTVNQSINDIILVQSKIDNIQEQIERLKASSRQLENQITFASITVGLIEPPVIEEKEEEEIVEQSPFIIIFNDTVAFASLLLQVEVRGLLILIIGFAPLYPLLGVAYLLYRRYYVRIKSRTEQNE